MANRPPPKPTCSLERRAVALGRTAAHATSVVRRLHHHLHKPASEWHVRSLAEELAAIHERLVSKTASLAEEVRALEDSRRELTAAVEAAEQANLRQTQFFAAASHDLLQPLNAARLFLSALMEMRFRPQNRALVDRTDQALSSAEALLGTFLDIAMIDAGGLRPEITNFPISSLLVTLAKEFEPFAVRKEVSFQVVPSTVRVLSDIRLLRRIIQNLVSNAIRYTPTGKVLLGCRRRPDGLRIEVWDTGRGIPPGKLETVFQEFQRLEPAKEDHDRGMGLGLAIVQRLARSLGHPITVRSEVGKGSLFAVTVPYGRAMSALRPNDVVPAVGAQALKGALVVFVENDDRMFEAMTALLATWSCDAVMGHSADEVLRKLRNGTRAPDMVIADYHLDQPETGLDVIERVRCAHGASMPAMVITADRSPELREAAQHAGCAILTKPVKPAQLRALMTHLLR